MGSLMTWHSAFLVCLPSRHTCRGAIDLVAEAVFTVSELPSWQIHTVGMYKLPSFCIGDMCESLLAIAIGDARAVVFSTRSSTFIALPESSRHTDIRSGRAASRRKHSMERCIILFGNSESCTRTRRA